MPVINIQRGFTLVELIIGIIVFAIALSIVTVVVVPSASRSVDPMMQVRAAELAQSLLNEISSKSFDENSDRLNGQIRCNEDLDGDEEDRTPSEFDTDIGERPCTLEGALGPDGEDRDEYDDVDDYDGLMEPDTGDGIDEIRNSTGQDLVVNNRSLYHGFIAEVEVFYDGNYDGVKDNWAFDQNAKLIRVTITTPTDQTYQFTTYRSNF